MRYVMIALLLCTGCAFKLWPPEVAFGGASVTKKGVEAAAPAREILSFILALVDAIPGVDVEPLPQPEGGRCEELVDGTENGYMTVDTY